MGEPDETYFASCLTSCTEVMESNVGANMLTDDAQVNISNTALTLIEDCVHPTSAA